MLNNQSFLAFLFLAAVGFLVFYPGLQAGFVGDDFIWMEKSRHLSEFSFFNPSGLAFAKGRPGTMVIFTLLNKLFPLNSTGFHNAVLVFHIMNAFLLFLILRSFGLNVGFSLLTSLLFMVHFSNEENIFWVSSLCTVFCMFFYLLAIWAYLRWLATYRMVFKVVALFFSILAVLVREDAVTVPLIFMGLDFLKNQSESEKSFTLNRYLKRNSVFFLPALLFLAYRLSSLVYDSRGYNFTLNPAIWLQNVIYFLVNLPIPVRFVFDKIGYSVQESLRNGLLTFRGSSFGALGIIVVFLVLFFLAMKARRKIPNLIKAGIILFIIGMFPYLLLVGNGPRFLYFPLVGGAIVISTFIVFISESVFKKNPQKGVLIFVLVFIAVSAIVIHERAHWWVKAGQSVESIMAESKVLTGRLGENELAYIANLPRRINGVYVFHIGYNEALSLFHPEIAWRLQDIGAKDLDELRGYRDRRIFTYEDGKMVEVTRP